MLHCGASKSRVKGGLGPWSSPPGSTPASSVLVEIVMIISSSKCDIFDMCAVQSDNNNENKIGLWTAEKNTGAVP